jgi:DNA-binding NarL/FixJ family response regulator
MVTELTASPTILIADDHEMIRDAVSQTLSAAGDFKVLNAGDFASVLSSLESMDHPIEMLLLDVFMPGMSGLDSVQQVLTSYPALKVVLFSGNVTNDFVFQAFKLGVRGYVPKTLPLRSLRSALNLVQSGQMFLPMSLLKGPDTGGGLDAGSDHPSQLTPKETRILQFVAEGKTNKEIAWSFGVSEVTIKMYMRSVFSKLGASNRTHAVMLAKAKMLL